jgi:hypothetical protein
VGQTKATESDELGLLLCELAKHGVSFCLL